MVGHHVDLGEWLRADQMNTTPAAWQRKLGWRWAVQEYFVKWGDDMPHFSKSVPTISLTPATSHRRLARGYYDGYLTKMVREFHGRRVILRYAAEMNWHVVPWHRKDFIHGWRYMYRWMHKHAPNVELWWCVTGQSTRDGSAWKWWPGYHYVDWSGFDVFAFRGDHRSFRQLSKQAYKHLAQYPRPVAIGEFGIDASFGDAYRAQWLDHARRRIARWRKLRMAIYFNSHPGGGDWRLNTPKVFTTWKRWGLAMAR